MLKWKTYDLLNSIYQPLEGGMSWRKYYRLFNENWRSMVFCEYSNNLTEVKERFIFWHWILETHNVSVWKIFWEFNNGLLLDDLWNIRLDTVFWKIDFDEYLLYVKSAFSNINHIHWIKNISIVWDHIQNTSFFFESAKKIINHSYFKALWMNKWFVSNMISCIIESLAEMKHEYVWAVSDFHSRNIMLKLGKVFLLDYQDIRRLPRALDYGAFICDPYVNYSKRDIYLILHVIEQYCPIQQVLMWSMIKLLHALRLYLNEIYDKNNSSYVNSLENWIQRFYLLGELYKDTVD